MFEMPGFHIWDPSVIEVDGRYHLFASRWPSDDTHNCGFEGWKKSHVIRAISDNLFGPYTFADIVIEPRTGQWDCIGNHNPKITLINGMYLLYYLGVTDKTHWATGFAWADVIEGPWSRSDRPSIPTNNPALWVHGNGSAYCVGKKRSPLVPDVRPFTNWMEALRAPRFDRDYEVVGDPMTNRLPSNYELEDPTLWWDGEHYHVIVTDWKARATGIERAGAHYRSADGVVYELVSSQPVFDRTLVLEDQTLTVARRERPQIVLDDKQSPIALCTSYRLDAAEAGVAITPVRMQSTDVSAK